MKNMEDRMKEIELSLRNVKILLKEKVAQLKDQVCSGLIYKIHAVFQRAAKSQTFSKLETFLRFLQDLMEKKCGAWLVVREFS